MSILPKRIKPLTIALLTVFTLAMLVLSLQSDYSITMAVDTLSGKMGETDFIQEWTGAQALLTHGNAYPPFQGESRISSTHPPTAFLFALPTAPFSYTTALMLWAWAMLVLLAVGLMALGVRWYVALGLTMTGLFYPTIVGALHNTVFIWFAGLALAWKFRDRPFLCAALIAVASLTKYFPVLVLLAALLTYTPQQRVRAILGAVTVWTLALVTLALLHVEVLTQYFTVNATASPYFIGYDRNGALLIVLLRAFGLPGVAFGIGFLASVTYLRRDDAWLVTQFLAVALLPIAWLYSIVPLFAVWYSFRRSYWLLLVIPLGIFPALCVLMTGLMMVYPKISQTMRARRARLAFDTAG